MAIQTRFPEYNPIIEMAAIANDPEVPLEMRFAAHKEIAQYVEPKRKAIEVDAAEGGAFEQWLQSLK